MTKELFKSDQFKSDQFKSDQFKSDQFKSDQLLSIINTLITTGNGNPEIYKLIEQIRSVVEAGIPRINGENISLSDNEKIVVNKLMELILDCFDEGEEYNRYELGNKINVKIINLLIKNGIISEQGEEKNNIAGIEDYLYVSDGIEKLLKYIRENIHSTGEVNRIEPILKFDEQIKSKLFAFFGSLLKSVEYNDKGIDVQINDILGVYRLVSALGLRELPVYKHCYTEGETHSKELIFNSNGVLSKEVNNGKIIAPMIDVSHFILEGRAKNLVEELIKLGFVVRKNTYAFSPMSSGENTEIIISW